MTTKKRNLFRIPVPNNDRVPNDKLPPYTDKPKAPQHQGNKLIKPKFPNKPSYKPG